MWEASMRDNKSTIEKNKVNCILIPIEEYKELLEIKGRYEENKDNKRMLISMLCDELSNNKITVKQAREILGFEELGGK